MKKKLVIIIVLLIIIAIIVGAIVFLSRNNKKSSANVALNSVEDIETLIENIYDKTKIEMFGLETQEIDVNDETVVSSYTGLKDGKDIEFAVVSESMVTSQAYSMLVVKVKDGADVEKVKKEMCDNIDMRKWICVSAEKLYTTSVDNVIFLIMSSEEKAKPQYDAFKEIVGGELGKELSREEIDNYELDDEMLLPAEMETFPGELDEDLPPEISFQ